MALSAPRVQTERLGDESIPPLLKLPVKGSTRIWAGAMVAIDDGYAIPATDDTGLRIAGRAEATVDNRSGSDGDKVITVRRGAFKWNNSDEGDEITQADVGKVCYAVDDQTVGLTDDSGARSPAGTILQIEADGVFVETGVDLQLADKLADT